MKQQVKTVLQFFFFLSIGLGILYYLYYTSNVDYNAERASQGLPYQDYLVKLKNDFANVNYFWIGLVVVAFMISNFSRAARWAMLLNRLKTDGTKVKFHNSFMATMVLYVTNYVVPRAGEVARCGIMNRYEGIPIEKGLGTVFLDRLLDLLCLGLMFLLTLVLEFDILWGYLSENAFQSNGEAGESGVSGLAIFGILMVVGGGILYLLRDKIQQTAIYTKIKNLLLGFVEGLQTIRQLDNLGLFILHTVVIWAMYYLMLYLAFFAFAPTAHLGPVAGLLIFIFGALGIVVPAPGGIGSYQFFVSFALASFYAISNSDALSFANISFFAPFLCNIFFGVLSIILLPVFNKKAVA